ncbi:hypothetical protein AA0115_g7206 [Alternaria tenuissima]|uniref:RING-type domain-containing protein n=1 Tax=Alternaria tenuissima TaxID=119927 RepID=A0AB37WDZ7_9PLEO|nr:hypothetical protein AA0115_g7206 [Alternaria tenuissima]
MTGITPADDGTVDYPTSITVPSLQSRCDTCKNDLTIDDKHKGSDKYWKNCRTCRERKTASKRKRTPSTSSSSVATTDTTKKKRNTDYNADAFMSLLLGEAKQPASTLEPEHTSSPDIVPSVQSATTSDLEENSDDAEVELATERPQGQRDPIMFRNVSQQAPQDDLLKRIRDRRAEMKNNEASEVSSRVVVLKLPKGKVCSVCAETLPWQRFPRLADCEHDRDVYDECFLLWLKQQMESVTNVLCPSSGCNHAITHEDVRMNTPQDVFTR